MPDKREVFAWIVPIGHAFDLEDLPLWFAGQRVHVAERNGAFELVIPVAIIGDHYKPIRAFAEAHLGLSNGVGRLLDQAFRPFSLTEAPVKRAQLANKLLERPGMSTSRPTDSVRRLSAEALQGITG